MKKLLRKLRALINNTFVADCPMCHTHFYGNHGYATHISTKGKNYRIICKKCENSTKVS